MNLTSPRINPYSELKKTEEKLKENGFSHTVVVKNEQEAAVNGLSFKASQWNIAEHHRFINKDHESESKALYGLINDNGDKGILVTPYGKFQDETIDAFLRNVDASNPIDNISQ